MQESIFFLGAEALAAVGSSYTLMVFLAAATVFSQYVSGIGILMVQGLVNSFGTVVMATMVALFCILASSVIFCLAKPLMQIFIEAEKTEIIAVGVQYLRIEGGCYIGIGILFLLYGYYRAVNRPAMSVILTVASLGTRVLLAYILSAIPAIGVIGIWVAVPIGWALADMIGIIVYLRKLCAKDVCRNGDKRWS